MNRYEPTIGDELVNSEDTLTVTDLPVDTTGAIDIQMVELTREDGVVITKNLSGLRTDLKHGRRTVKA